MEEVLDNLKKFYRKYKENGYLNINRYKEMNSKVQYLNKIRLLQKIYYYFFS